MKSSLAQRLKAHHRQRRVQTVVFLVLFAMLFLLALPGAELDFSKFADSLPRMADFLGRMAPPDMSVMTTVLTSTLETLQIAFVGTFLSVVLSFPLALMAATNLAPAWLSQPTRWLLGAIRAVPLILLALFFVSTVGLGPFPGVLAITVHSVGMLGKFYAEAFENADPGVLEALDSAGATLLQRLRFGILTQVAPDLVRDTPVPPRTELSRVAHPGAGGGWRDRLLHPAVHSGIPIRTSRHPHYYTAGRRHYRRVDQYALTADVAVISRGSRFSPR